MSSAIVVGSGPNGLGCAAALARQGLEVTVLEAAEEIGGGTRTSELTVPGLLHDECSAVHPMGSGSPFFRSLGLERYGLEWRWPEVDLAHPLDDGSAAVMLRSIEETAARLGDDGDAWRRLFGVPSRTFETLNEDLLRPLLHVPRHPIGLARFGAAAAMPIGAVARMWKGGHARALWGGVAGHSFCTFSQPMGSAVGMALVCAGHAFGWPVARGGSQSIANALAAVIREHGGTIETGTRVTALADLPAADAIVLDLAPDVVANIAGGRLPDRVARAYRRYRRGPGAFKLDLAVQGGIPWANDASRRAGTVHVGGSFEELASAERDINRGRMPERPLVLVAQQYLADPDRSAGDVHPIWAYAHVPRGYDGDAAPAILAQLERFAPGVRDRIVGSASRSTSEIAAANPNFIGGDIINGANTPKQLLFRPRLALNPYATGIPGVFICSAATPPGGGVHGICGFNAAQVALRHLRS